VFLSGTGNIANLPGANRISVHFKGSNGTVVGSTSVAVQTTGYTPPATSAEAFTASAATNATAGTAYSFCYCSPTPSGSNGLCGFPTQSNPSGGNPPYHFQLGSGGGFPPLGVILQPNGCLSGTPSVAGTSSFSVCAIDLNGTQICRPVSVTTMPASGTTYVGALSGSGTFSKDYPDYGTTCTGTNTFSGTIMVSSMTAVGGAVTGTVSISGTWTSTITGGSTYNFTCLDNSAPINSSGPITVSGTSITWSTSFNTAGVGSAGVGSTITGAFSGTISPTTISGTVTETSSVSMGSAVIPVTLKSSP